MSQDASLAVGDRGPKVSGDSCVLQFFGIPFGLVAMPDLAVDDAIRSANTREHRTPPNMYNGLADAAFSETFMPVGHCFLVTGTAIRIATKATP